MANKLRITSKFAIECGGYSGEGLWSEPNLIDKTTDKTSGTERVTYVFHSSCKGTDSNSQQVRVSVHYDWRVTYNEYADATIAIHGYVDGVTATNRGSGAGCGGQRTFLKIGFSKDNLPYSIGYRTNQTGQIGGAGNLGEITFTIPSGSSESRSTLYVFNGWIGHEGDGCSIYVDRMKGGLTFSNLNAIIRVPPVISPSCTTTGSSTADIKASIDYKNGNGSNSWSYCISNTKNFNSCVKSGDGEGNASVKISGLQPNSTYYVRWSANNGYKTNTAECQFTTLTPNTIRSATPNSANDATVALSVQYGGKVYPPTTKLQYRACGSTNWVSGPSTNTTTLAELKLTGLEENTCYEVRAITKTQAGSYTGNIVTFKTPRKTLCVAYYTSISPNIDEDSLETSAELCYRWESTDVPATITPYYRIKNGYDSTWIKAGDFTVNTLTGTHCFTISDLFPNQTVYETYLHTATEDTEWDGEISEFVTPLLPIPDIHNCENFEYLWDLLCQAIKTLYNGRLDIYANPYTKSLCDPLNPTPTHLALWSRALRFFHSMLCLLCDMSDANLTSSKEGQYLVGEAGWVDFLEAVVEGGEDAWRLVYSDGVYKYIEEKMHTVWHYHEAVDYIVNSLSDLSDSKYSNATKVIVTSENKVYKKVNGSWVLEDTKMQPDDFAVYHINYASDTSFGNVPAQSAYYYWQGTWNNLDADLTKLAAAIKELDKNKDRLVMNENGADRMHINTVDKDAWNCSNYPTGERWVSFITESMTQPDPIYHTVEFTLVPDEDDRMPNVQSQQVIDGGMAQIPTPPVGDCDFIRWEDINNPGTAFDFNTVIKKDYNLVAQLDCGDYITTESSVIITAENGDKFVK